MANQPFDSSDTSISPSPRRTWLWVLGILAAFGFLSLLACGGILFLSFGKISEVVGGRVVEEIGDHPVLKDRVGTIRSARMDWNASMQDAKDNPGKSRGVVVLEGSKANAKLAFEVGSEDRPASAELMMEDGTRIPLDLDEDLWPEIEQELKSGQSPDEADPALPEIDSEQAFPDADEAAEESLDPPGND